MKRLIGLMRRIFYPILLAFVLGNLREPTLTKLAEHGMPPNGDLCVSTQFKITPLC